MLSIINNSEAARPGNNAPVTPDGFKPNENAVPEGLRLRAPGEMIMPGDLMRMKGRTWAPVPVNHSIGFFVDLFDHLDFFCAAEVANG